MGRELIFLLTQVNDNSDEQSQIPVNVIIISLSFIIYIIVFFKTQDLSDFKDISD